MEPGSAPDRVKLPPGRTQEELLQVFLRWLQANGVQLHSSKIKHLEGSTEELGVFCASDNTEGVMMVTPLQLAITPMRILQDADFGNMYGKLFEDGEVDDRLLMILFLMVERIRGPHSFWAPYFDVLPTSFGTPFSYTEQELQELKGTALYNATKIQLKNLKALFAEKVKSCAEQFLSFVGGLEREITFQDFLWANCIFWTRALNIPCPHLFVFPSQLPLPVSIDACSKKGEQFLSKHPGITTNQLGSEGKGSETTWEGISQQTMQGESNDVEFLTSNTLSSSGCNQGTDKVIEENVGDSNKCTDGADIANNKNSAPIGDEQAKNEHSAPIGDEQATVWVEGLVPGIDFCNHDPKGVAHWEVDGDKGYATGAPNSMYLTVDVPLPADKEILISYGNKGNEELLFLYGFVLEDNPDDYLMVHFPKEALDRDDCSDAKVQLLQEQGLTLRWLLPNTLLQRGFYSKEQTSLLDRRDLSEQVSSGYSWSGNRKPPTYLNQCVFPEETISALRVVAMKGEDLQIILSMLQELSLSGLQRPPSDQDVRAAVWEVCGNACALQLLADLLAARMLELEEGTGSEESDKELLERDFQTHLSKAGMNSNDQETVMDSHSFLSKNVRACVIYRKGQKYLAEHFLKEAEHLLELCIAEEQFCRENDK